MKKCQRKNNIGEETSRQDIYAVKMDLLSVMYAFAKEATS
jgi:hypothetical protein